MSQAGSSEAANKYAPKPPKAVAAQVAAAEKMLAEQPGQQAPAPPAQQPPPPSPVSPPPAPGTPPPAAAQPAAPPQQPPAGAGPEYWEQRFKSEMGRIEAKETENRALMERLNQLEGTLANMRAAGAQPATPPPPPAPVQLITPEEETEYGKDMLDVVGRRAKEMFVPELSAVQAKIAMLENRLEGTTQVLQRGQMATVYDTLNSKVPNWQQINVSDGFKAWVAQVDPYAGRSRGEMLREAFTRQDAQRVLRFFEGYLEAIGTPPTQPGATAATPPAQPGHPAQPTLEELAAPSGARSAPQGLSPEKPTYTSAWVQEFMKARRDGKWKGREADADTIERDIYQAQHEGRFIV